MKPDSYFLKKRKLFVTNSEDLGLPAPKHICCNPTSLSRCDSLYLKSLEVEDEEVFDSLVESTQDSNSLAGDSMSFTTDVILENKRFSRKKDSYDEASTSWANSRSTISENENETVFSLESRNMSVNRNVNGIEDCQFSEWNDIDVDVDGLEECISADFYKDCKQQNGDELQGFLSSSGVSSTLFRLSSERWSADQEAQMGRQKPTIDQEFEQYFSTLML